MKKVTLYITQLICCCLLLVCCVIFTQSCKKYIAIPPPRDQVIAETVFEDDATALAALNGLYSSMMSSNLLLCNGGMSVFAGLCADEIVNTAPSTVYDPYFSNAISPDDGTTNYNRIWFRAYVYIYGTNSILKGAERSVSLSASVKRQIRGEAYFSRAFYYWYLINLYADVPLLLSTSYTANAIEPRSPVSVILSQISNDLDSAELLLPAAYLTAGKVRANKWAAVALQARFYLYRQDWAAAEMAATEVIASGYTLAANPNAAFTQNNSEAILQFIPVAATFNTGDGNAFVPVGTATAKANFVLTTSLLSAFEPGDLRRTQWVGSKTVSGVTYLFPNKYKINAGSVVTENNNIIRLAEMYLIRAEARAKQNNVAGAVADLNVIRLRAGLPLLSTALSQANCLLAVEKERRIEFFAEWGHRWFDLKRTGRIDAVLSANKVSWQPHAALFPIPQQELEKNPFLNQNSGY
jgi:hypothetical protein